MDGSCWWSHDFIEREDTFIKSGQDSWQKVIPASSVNLGAEKANDGVGDGEDGVEPSLFCSSCSQFRYLYLNNQSGWIWNSVFTRYYLCYQLSVKSWKTFKIGTPYMGHPAS